MLVTIGTKDSAFFAWFGRVGEGMEMKNGDE